MQSERLEVAIAKLDAQLQDPIRIREGSVEISPGERLIQLGPDQPAVGGRFGLTFKQPLDTAPRIGG